jgi:hypothetical protein
MKKLIVISMILALAASVSLANPTVTFNRVAGTYQGNGGEFNLKPNADLSYVLNGYDSKAKFNGGFQTFCLEYTEYIEIGKTYNAAISTKAMNGGVGTAGDPISKGTAYLYLNFAKGNLAGYDYTVGNGRNADAEKLQKTIWWLEGEQSDPGASNEFRQLVLSQFGTAAAAKADNVNLYPVRALNLTDRNGGLHQDQLVLVPAPGAIVLSSLGAVIVGWLRTRKIAVA